MVRFLKNSQNLTLILNHAIYQVLEEKIFGSCFSKCSTIMTNWIWMNLWTLQKFLVFLENKKFRKFLIFQKEKFQKLIIFRKFFFKNSPQQYHIQISLCNPKNPQNSKKPQKNHKKTTKISKKS